MKTKLITAAFAIGLALTSNIQAAEVTPAEAHAIGVDAYLYFYPLVTMDITRKQSTNIEPGKEFGKGPMNMFVNVPAYPPADYEGGRASQLRHALFHRVAGSHQGAAVVSAPDTDGRFYLLPMLDMWTMSLPRPAGGRPAPRRAISSSRRPAGTGRVTGRASRASRRRRPMSGSSAAPRPTDRRIMTRCTRFRRATRSRRCHSWGKAPEPVAVKIDPDRGHEDAAEDSGRYHAGRQVLRLCGRTFEASPAAHHRPANHCPDEAHRHRAGQELSISTSSIPPCKKALESAPKTRRS